MRYRFLYIGADLCKPVLQPDISEHCETTDMGWCITRCAWLLSFRWVLIPACPQRAGSGWVGLQVPGSAPRWFTRPDGHPPRH